MNEKQINYYAIFEMSNSEGWKELEKMLEWDVKFGKGWLERRREVKKDNADHEKEWVTDIHDIGWARGTLGTAQKYLDLVKTARLKKQI